MTPTNLPQRTKMFGMDKRAVMTLLALVLFFAVGLSGILIAQRQRQVSGPVSPNAPGSRPQAAMEQIHNCTVALRVPTPPSPTPVASYLPTPTPVPSIIPSPLVTPVPTPVVSPTPRPTPVTYTCNSTCTTNAQCQTANAAYVCTGGRCRMGGNTSSTTCAYKCNSRCTSDAECQTVNPGYKCYKTSATQTLGYCRMAANQTSTSCAYSCPTVTTKPTTNTCAPSSTDTGTVTWNWYPVSGVTQYQVQIYNSAGQIQTAYDKGCKGGDEYYNCFQGVCTYTTYHLPGTYTAKIKACSSSCPAGGTTGFYATPATTISVCK